MGTVHNFEGFRASRSDALKSDEPPARLKLKDPLKDACPGCGAQRFIVIVFHGTGASAGTVTVSKLLPHLLCNGERIILQHIPGPPPPRKPLSPRKK